MWKNFSDLECTVQIRATAHALHRSLFSGDAVFRVRSNGERGRAVEKTTKDLRNAARKHKFYWTSTRAGTANSVLGIKQISQNAYEEIIYRIMHSNVKHHVWSICSICTVNSKLNIYLHVPLIFKFVLFCAERSALELKTLKVAYRKKTSSPVPLSPLFDGQ